MKNRGASAHENTSQNKTKIGTTLIMAPTVVTVFRVKVLCSIVFPGAQLHSSQSLARVVQNGGALHLSEVVFSVRSAYTQAQN